MTQKEQARIQVLNSFMADHMTTEQAATLMGVSARHTRRVLAAYRRDGAAAIAHGNRGRRPANATPHPLATDVVLLARTRYAGANHTHLSELLRDREGIDIGRNTLRKILTDAGVNSPRRRRPPKHRVRRQRMPREGMLVQIDGSYHRWLGEDGPQFTLPLAVDDATGCVVNALFCELENTRQLLTADAGSDTELRHTSRTLFRPPWCLQAHTAVGDRRRSHPVLAAAMGELGVQLIFARSPQAKGRVERTAGTLQDRLVTELRLVGATTIDDANRLLDDFLPPRFNERFRVPSQHAGTAYRVLDPGMCLDTVLCLKYRRRVGRDNTGEVPLAHPAVASRQGSPELCRICGGCTRSAGRTTVSATRRVYRRLPGSAAPSKYPAQLRHEDCTHGRSQPLHQRCHQKVGGRSGVNGHNARSGQTSRRCRPQRRRKSSQDCDSAIQKAHPASDGEMEGGAEGEAQGPVHPWDRPGTEHSQRHREEVHEC